MAEETTIQAGTEAPKSDPISLQQEIYRKLVGIDPTECVRIKGNLSDLEIRLEEGKVPFLKFLDGRVSAVSIDYISSEEASAQVVDEMKQHHEMTPMDEAFFKKLYATIQRVWGSIQYSFQPVGITDTTRVYNGLPGFLDIKEFEKSPAEETQRAVMKFYEAGPVAATLIVSRPHEHIQTNVYLHRKFLKEHPVTRKSMFTKAYESIHRKPKS